MNKYQKGFSLIIIILAFLILAGAGWAVYCLMNKQWARQTACTAEVKVCSDGTSVGRTGPDCDFAACPEVKEDKNSGWETYASDKFSFDYPSSAEPDVISDDYIKIGGIEIIIQGKTEEECVVSKEDAGKQYLILRTSDLEINGALFNYYTNYPENIGDWCGMSSGCQYKDVYRTFHNGLCYEISSTRWDRVSTSSSGGEYRSATAEELKVPDFFEKMVSTFKFLY